MTLIIKPLADFPLVKTGDDLVGQTLECLSKANLILEEGDILVFAQKVVSKSEGRLVNLNNVMPSNKAKQLALATEKDPRFIELVLQESRKVIRYRKGVLITEHRNGYICANAGIDHSNVSSDWGDPEDWVLLLPEDSDISAARLRKGLEEHFGVKLGIMIIDSHGRPWRMGTVGVAIGISGLPGLIDLRGEKDLFGYKLKVSILGVADELAAAASLMMGQSAEGYPVVHVRGFPYMLREASVSELIRPEKEDLFR